MEKFDWKGYWESVTKCVTKPNGDTTIFHENGQIERFNAQGRRMKRQTGDAEDKRIFPQQKDF